MVTHILRSDYFRDPEDFAKLRAVNRAMRDAVDEATGREYMILILEAPRGLDA